MALPSFKAPTPTWFIVDEFNSTLSNSLLQKLEGECVQDFSAVISRIIWVGKHLLWLVC